MAEIILPIPGSFDATNPPGMEVSNGIPKATFDDATDEIFYWNFRIPSDYSSALALVISYSMAAATSNAVIVACQVMAVTDGDSQDLDAESYDTVNTSSATTVPGTVGFQDVITLTLTNADSVAGGDLVRLKFSRDANNASDTAAGDMELWAASVTYTAA